MAIIIDMLECIADAIGVRLERGALNGTPLLALLRHERESGAYFRTGIALSVESDDPHQMRRAVFAVKIAGNAQHAR